MAMLQTSTLESYSRPRMSSGAIQYGVPTTLRRLSCSSVKPTADSTARRGAARRSMEGGSWAVVVVIGIVWLRARVCMRLLSPLLPVRAPVEGASGAILTCEPEVRDLDAAVEVDEDVVALDVAVQAVLPVEVRQAHQHLLAHEPAAGSK